MTTENKIELRNLPMFLLTLWN